MGCNTSKTTTNNVVVGGGDGGDADTNNNNNDVETKKTTTNNDEKEEKTIVYSVYTKTRKEDVEKEAKLILQRAASNTTSTGGDADGDYSNMYRRHTIKKNDDEPYKKDMYARYKLTKYDAADDDDDGYNKYSYDEVGNVEYKGSYKVYVDFRHQMAKNAPPASAIMNDEKEKEADKVIVDAEYERAKTDFNHHNTDTYSRHDWNAKFLELFDRNVATPQDQRKRTNDITNLTNEFTEHIQVNR